MVMGKSYYLDIGLAHLIFTLTVFAVPANNSHDDIDLVSTRQRLR